VAKIIVAKTIGGNGVMAANGAAAAIEIWRHQPGSITGISVIENGGMKYRNYGGSSASEDDRNVKENHRQS
jgi:hypothetical protein